MREPNISPWRRAVCGDLTSAFDFARTDTAARPAARHRRLLAAGPRPPPRLRAHAAGRRHDAPPGAGRQADPPAARTRRYVDGARHRRPARTASTFSGGAGRGRAVLRHLGEPHRRPLDVHHRGRQVARGHLEHHATRKGVTDLTVHGPNGFLRSFKRPGTTAGPEVTARHDAATGNLDLTITNAGSVDGHLTVTNAYAARPRPSRCAGRDRHAHRRSARQQALVRRDGRFRPHANFLRRFAGKVETGPSGVTDPAILTN